LSTEILNLEGDAVTRAEANMRVIVLVRIRTLRRCREDPFRMELMTRIKMDTSFTIIYISENKCSLYHK